MTNPHFNNCHDWKNNLLIADAFYESSTSHPSLHKTISTNTSTILNFFVYSCVETTYPDSDLCLYTYTYIHTYMNTWMERRNFWFIHLASVIISSENAIFPRTYVRRHAGEQKNRETIPPNETKRFAIATTRKSITKRRTRSGRCTRRGERSIRRSRIISWLTFVAPERSEAFIKSKWRRFKFNRGHERVLMSSQELYGNNLW